MISIIVPVYNAQDYIRKCLNSIIKQSYADIEIIIVNDGSTDNSINTIQDLMIEDNRIKIINRENGGLSAARNTGIAHAKGEFLMFVDSDDELEKNAIEQLYNDINKNQSDVSMGKVSIIYDTHQELKDSDDWYYAIRYNGLYAINDDIINDIHCSAWGKLFKQKIIKNQSILFPEGLCYEDAYWHWAYLTSCNKISFIKYPVYKYYRRKNSIMSNTYDEKEGLAIQHLFICEKIIDFWQEKNLLSKRYKTAVMILEKYFWFSFRYSQKFEKARVVYECARIARKFSLPIEENSTIDKICKGNLSFLFLDNNANNAITYAKFLQINEVLSRFLPYNSKKRKIAYCIARHIYKIIKKIQ